jgi:hypothetical protein
MNLPPSGYVDEVVKSPLPVLMTGKVRTWPVPGIISSVIPLSSAGFCIYASIYYFVERGNAGSG